MTPARPARRSLRRVTASLAHAGLLAGLALTGCETSVSHRSDGLSSMREGDTAAAIEHFQRSVEARSTDFQAQYWLGVNLLKADDALRAQAPLEQALALRPGDPAWTPRIADALADSYYLQGETEKLYDFLDNMVTTYEQQSHDYMRQAKFMGLVGDSDGQKLALEKAAFFAPAGDIRPYLAQADFYEAVNDVPAAIEALGFAYHTDPSSEVVKNRLRGLGIIPGPTVGKVPDKPVLPD